MIDIDLAIRIEVGTLVLMGAFIYMDLWHYVECGKSLFFGEKHPHPCP
jgi:hypothetical protein